ncbi:MAG: DMT family transporter [Candidatus Heimdallarchaeota archaeon]|nr:DMT family transporter [Candidatus Heimdallarchaeota archaeon]
MTIIQNADHVQNTKLETKLSELEGKSDKRLYVILFVFSILGGITWPAGKIVGESLSPVGAAFYRYTISLPLFIIITWINRRNHNDSIWYGKTKNGAAKLHIQLAILGLLGFSIYTVFFFEGVKQTSASDATLIFSMTPALTAIIANYFIPDDKLTKNKVLGLGFVLSGVAIIFTQSPNTDVPNRILGNSLILGASLVLALQTVFSKPVFKKINVVDFSTWIMFYGWLFLMIPTAFQNPEYFTLSFMSDVKLKVILAILYLAIFIVYATIVLAYGVSQMGPSRTAIFMNFIPVFGVISAIIILGEAFSLWYIPAFLAITLGVNRVTKKSK